MAHGRRLPFLLKHLIITLCQFGYLQLSNLYTLHSENGWCKLEPWGQGTYKQQVALSGLRRVSPSTFFVFFVWFHSEQFGLLRKVITGCRTARPTLSTHTLNCSQSRQQMEKPHKGYCTFLSFYWNDLIEALHPCSIHAGSLPWKWLSLHWLLWQKLTKTFGKLLVNHITK